jgi:hypothetical protein
MKAHIGVNADSGLVHKVTTTPANAHDVMQAHDLLHGQEWEISMMPVKRKALDKIKAKSRLDGLD